MKPGYLNIPNSLVSAKMGLIPKLGDDSSVTAVQSSVRNSLSADRRARAQRRSTIVPSERPFLNLKDIK